CIGYSNEVIYFFLAEDLTETEAHSEADEFVEPFRLPFAEAVAMARRGEILDAKSEVAILRAAAHLEDREAAGNAP
ncbi:MAG: NUDIX hydrolase, partial [Bacteroidota bacterium]